MNPPLTFANALTQLKLLTSQTGNFTFSDDELTQALTEAWNDTYVVKRVTDSTVTFAPGTYTYAVPSTLTVVRSIQFNPTSTDPLTEIDPSLYQVINNQIIFRDQVRRWLGDTYTLFVVGSYKFTTADSLTSTHAINYVLNLSAENLLNRLLLKKTFVFLTNDTNVGDIVRAIQLYSNRVLTAKQGLLRQFESM